MRWRTNDTAKLLEVELLQSDRVAFAVLGLEALLLAEKYELRFRLALRVSRILAALGYSGTRAFALTKAAYDIRSRFFHASPPHRTDADRRIAQQISAVLRIAMVLTLFMNASSVEVAKARLLKLIDGALQDPLHQVALDVTIRDLPEVILASVCSKLAILSIKLTLRRLMTDCEAVPGARIVLESN